MRHGAFVARDFPVGQQLEACVEQQSVDPFAWQSSFASRTDESEDSVWAVRISRSFSLVSPLLPTLLPFLTGKLWPPLGGCPFVGTDALEHALLWGFRRHRCCHP